MKILLFANIGTQSNGFYHVGDEAMFLETFSWYKYHFPKCQITAISSNQNHESIAITEIKNMIDLNTTNLSYLFKILIKTVIYRFFNQNKFSQHEFQLIELIKKQDRIHFTGGGNITSLFKNWLYFSLSIIIVSRIFNKEIILTSQTIGPFDLVDKYITKMLLFKIKVVRRGDQMLDAAYNLPTNSNYTIKQKKCLRIGLSLHDWKTSNSYCLELLSTLNQISKKVLFEVYIIPHLIMRSPAEGDINFVNNILDNKCNFKVISPDPNELLLSIPNPANTIKKITSEMDMLISTRYHGLVFALSTNVPVFTFISDEYYNDKNVGILKQFYKNEYNKYCGNPNKIINIINNLSYEHDKLIKINYKFKDHYDLFFNNLNHKIL